jgi:ubiquinone/menaquinone biosynthesis C-methylase UbiE
VGVDLSESALDRARQRLSSWADRRELRQGDLAETLAEMPDATFDLVIASYSLHHLSESAKRLILLQIGRVLVADGIFIWADVMRDEGESRDQTMDRLEEHVRGQWMALTGEQRDRVVEHVRSSDFPESRSWMADAAGTAGLVFDRVLLDDPCFSAFTYVRCNPC